MGSATLALSERRGQVQRNAQLCRKGRLRRSALF